MKKTPRIALMILLPLLVIALGFFVMSWLVSLRPDPEQKIISPLVPLVDVVVAEPRDVQLSVTTHGTVVPRTESLLISEVSGRVIEISPSLVNGGFFEEEEILLRLDPIDYQVMVEEARQAVAVAERALAQEEADAGVAKTDWERMGKGEPDPLVLRVPQIAEATARLRAATTSLAKAERDIDRCTLRAPYAGRVRSEAVDLGQYVNRGVELARVYAVDYAEVRLLLPDSQLAYLDLSLAYRGGEADIESGLPVRLTSQFAGNLHHWDARIVRTEGELDPLSRMVVVVARVDNPYGHDEELGRPPLAVGMFVEAEIEGRTVPGAFALPRSALRGREKVHVIDETGSLRIRDVEVLQLKEEEIVLESGIETGDRVAITPLEIVTEGMKVDVLESGGER